MADREKLIALLGRYARCDDFCVESCTTCQYRYEENCNVQLIADHLLANGVTFATDTNVGCKWISVEEGLPETIVCNAGTAYSEAVIVWTSGKKAMVAVWDGSCFLCAADCWEAWNEVITHWMPLPKPPLDTTKQAADL